MTDNRFWCTHCKKEFKGDEVEKRANDTMFGDGRWWYCRTCGTVLIRYPEIGEKEQKLIFRVKQALAASQESEQSWSPDETCRLLLDMGELYRTNGSYREACLVLFNVREIAEHNHLSEFALSANDLFKKLTQMFNMQNQKVVSPKYLFEQFIAYYIPQ